jgi:hypothetical protein
MGCFEILKNKQRAEGISSGKNLKWKTIANVQMCSEDFRLSQRDALGAKL